MVKERIKHKLDQVFHRPSAVMPSVSTITAVASVATAIFVSRLDDHIVSRLTISRLGHRNACSTKH